MNGDPLVAALPLIGGLLILVIFLPPWRAILHRLNHAVMAWACTCPCRLTSDEELAIARFVSEVDAWGVR